MSATHATRLLLFADARGGRAPIQADDRQAKIRRYRLARLQLSAARRGTPSRLDHLKQSHD